MKPATFQLVLVESEIVQVGFEMDPATFKFIAVEPELLRVDFQMGPVNFGAEVADFRIDPFPAEWKVTVSNSNR